MRSFPFIYAFVGVVFLSGCGGPKFWERQGATVADFDRDHAVCFKEGQSKYGIGSEQIYKACMRAKGWTRTTTLSGLPDSRHFRGIEDDNEFNRIRSQEEIAEQMKQEGRANRESGANGALCDIAPNNRPPGTVCR
jgi:hypothetical protein